MPLYEFQCPLCKEKFERFGRMTEKTLAPVCPDCEVVTRQIPSLFALRFAEPLTVLQDLGSRGGQHLGYEKIGWQADSGISPKPGQPYKTAKEADGELWGRIKEV